MKMKKTLMSIVLMFVVMFTMVNFAEPTEDFHIPEPTTEPASGPELVEYYNYKEDKTYAPGSLTGNSDVDLSMVGKGLYYDGTDFYFFTDTGTMASNYMFTIEGDRFFFGEDGKMVKDEVVSYEDEIYYFDSNGAMYKNRWYSLETIDESDNTIEYTDYYFGPTGRAYRAGSGSNGLVVKTIDGEKYGFNSEAEKIEGYCDQDGNIIDPNEEPAYVDCVYYFDPEENGAATKGWHYYEGAVRGDEYENDEEIVLYFDDKTSRKVYARPSNTNADRCISRIIEGQRYMFDQNGVRKNKWYASEPGRASSSNMKYFDSEYDGYLSKGWFMAVPGKDDKSDLILDVNKKRHDNDEDCWYYATSDGNILRSTIRKIGNYTYAFDNDGVMQQGALVKVKGGTFIKAYMLDDLYKANVLFDPNETGGNADPNPYGHTDPINLDQKKGILNASAGEQWMYFLGEDAGEAKTGSMCKLNSPVKLELNDVDVYFMANSTGGYTKFEPTGIGNISVPVTRNKKMIQNGVVMQPSADDNNFGLVRTSSEQSAAFGNIINWQNEVVDISGQNYYNYVLVNSSGQQVTSRNKSIKDKQGNYLYVNETGLFIGAYPYQGTYHSSASSPIEYVDDDGNTRVIPQGQSYWTYKSNGDTKYGLPSLSDRQDDDYLHINFSQDSLISHGPYEDGYARFYYMEP